MPSHRRLLITFALLAACRLTGEVPSGSVACTKDRLCPDELHCFSSNAFPQGLCCTDHNCGGRMGPDEVVTRGPEGGASFDAAPVDPSDAPVEGPAGCDP